MATVVTLSNLVQKVVPPYPQDPFSPVLRVAVTPYVPVQEQERLLQEILALSSSDSNFARRAYLAIMSILAGTVVAPVVNSLVPSSAAAEQQSVLVRVLGTGFDPGSVILIEGNDAATVFVSANELQTTGSTVGVPPSTSFQFLVRTSTGVLSNSQTFTVTK